jgi:tetratricopeptide (TPR) repeat protein
MKIIQKLKIWKELKRLEARVHQSPSPSTFVDLGQVYINLGMYERTLQLADEGLALFPHSAELRKLRKFAKKNQLNGRIEDLRHRLAKAPHPKLYRELAAMYLELGDFDAVHGTCEECIRRFPDDDGAYLVLARARLTNFYRDLTAQDGLEAVRGLQKVIALDPGNVKAHKLLAEVLYRTGATVPCRHHLEVLRELGSAYADLEQMYTEASNHPGGDEDVEVLFHQVESRGRLVFGPVSRERRVPAESGAEDGLSSIRDALAQIAEFDGVRKAAYIRGAKALVKGDIRDGKDAFLRVSRVVAKAAQRSSRRMDMGNFSKAVVDGEFGHICLCSFGEVVAAVQCEARAPVDRVLDELQELVAGSLYLTGEAVE